MNLVRSFTELAALADQVCFAIGVFDGVHLGHQEVIRTARAEAQSHNAHAVVLTFDPHPMRVLHPAKAPLLLTSTAHKLRLIEQLGVETCLLITFDDAFAHTAPEDFIRQITTAGPKLQAVCVGSRFRFGYRRAGDMALIHRLSHHYGYHAREITSVTVNGEIVSSTTVRSHVIAGRLDPARAMLGRPFSILGTVERGDGVGHQLGFPTANLNPHNEALPPDGVYIASARLDGVDRPGLLNIGVRPTFAERSGKRILEIHLLDFDGDLYGRELEVNFLQHLRPEQKFASPADLRRQIAADVAQARTIVA